MTVFVLSFPIPRLGASVDIVGFTDGFKSLTSAEHCPSCIDCFVITGAETDVCWYTDGTLVVDATFSASSVLSIQSETFVRLSSGVSTGEILLRLDPQLLDACAICISFSAILALRTSSSCMSAISICFASRSSFSRRFCSSSCSFRAFSYKSITRLELDVFEITDVLLLLVLSPCECMLNSSICSDLALFLGSCLPSALRPSSFCCS